jgi:hypothetical protein
VVVGGCGGRCGGKRGDASRALRRAGSVPTRVVTARVGGAGGPSGDPLRVVLAGSRAGPGLRLSGPTQPGAGQVLVH